MVSTAPRSTPCTRGPTACRIAGLVLHPDIMGLRPLFDDLCRRLATHGFAVCAPEPFARAPADVVSAESRGAHGVRRRELDDDFQIGDLEAAADYLVVHDDVREVAVIGFCMGGMQALKAAATGRFDRAVAFYGMIRVPDGWQGPSPASRSTPPPTSARRSRSSAASTLHARGRHRGAARRVGRPARLRDRRVPRGRPRLRARPRTPGAPPRRRRRRLAPGPQRSCRPNGGRRGERRAVPSSERGVRLRTSSRALRSRILYRSRPSISSQPRRANSARALFTRSRLAPTRTASSSWVSGSRNWSLTPGELEQSLGRPGGHVEEHRVGQGFVGGAEPASQYADHHPEQLRAPP